MTFIQRQRLFESLGFEGGLCPWTGRNGVLLAFEGGALVTDIIANCRTERYTTFLAGAPEEVRVKLLAFEAHVIARGSQTINLKLDVWKISPLKTVGLFGVDFGYAPSRVKQLGRGLK